MSVPLGFPEPPAEFLQAIGGELLENLVDAEGEPNAHNVREVERRLDGFSGTLGRRAAVLQRQTERLMQDLADLEAQVSDALARQVTS